MKRNLWNRIWKKVVDSLGWCGWGCLETTVLREEEEKERNRIRRSRWVFWFVILLYPSLLAVPLFGQDLKENQKWIEQVDGGMVIPASSANAAAYEVGIGGDILVGYRFTRDFSLSGDLGYYDCDQKAVGGNSGEWLYTPLMAVARLNFGAGAVRPFLLLGAGIAFNTFSVTPAYTGIKVSERETDFLLSPGAGVMLIIGGASALYVQGRLDANFTTARAGGSPFTDSPSLFIPVKAGLSFFVL